MALAFLGIPRNGFGVNEIKPDPRERMHTLSETNKIVTSKL